MYYALDHPSDKSVDVGGRRGHNMFDLVKGDSYPLSDTWDQGIPKYESLTLVKYFDERVILQLLKGGQKRRKTS